MLDIFVIIADFIWVLFVAKAQTALPFSSFIGSSGPK